jgi:hypothetical protein
MGYDLERVVDDIPKWDLHLGAYEDAVLSGASRVHVDHVRAVLRYRTTDLVAEVLGPFQVEVWVSRLGGRRSVVHVSVETTSARRESHRAERWAARRVMRRVLAQAKRARASYAPPAWYPDPLGRFAERWWDGTRWTRFVWWRDALHVMDLAPRRLRAERDTDALATGMLSVRMTRARIPPLPPLIRPASAWLPRKRRLALLVRDVSCAVGSLVLLVVLVRIWLTT